MNDQPKQGTSGSSLLKGAAILGIAAIIYFIVLLRTGSVTKEDLAHVPGFESKLQPFLEKLHLL